MSQARPGGQGGGHSWRWPRMGRRPVLGGAAAGALGLSAAVGVGAAGAQREPQAGEIKIAGGAIAGVDPAGDLGGTSNGGPLRLMGAAEGLVRTRDGARLAVRMLWWGSLKPVAEVLQARWARVGVEVEVQGAPDYGVTRARLDQQDWDTVLNSWSTFGDLPSVLGRHMDAAGDLNHARLGDESIEGLLAGFAELLDPEARRQQALRLNERHAEAVPCAPLFATERLNAVHRAVRNHVPHFMGHQHELYPDLWVSA